MKELLITNKFPEAGRSKTRLGKDIGYEKSANLAKHLLEDIITTASKVCDVSIASCACDYDKFKETYPNQSIYNCKADNLFSKLYNIIRNKYSEKTKSLIIITGDILVSEQRIESWFEDLKKYNTIIGPTHDLRFYLFGVNSNMGYCMSNSLKEKPSILNVASALIKKGLKHPQIFAKTKILPLKRDIDSLRDLKILAGKMPDSCSKTKEYLKEIKEYL